MAAKGARGGTRGRTAGSQARPRAGAGGAALPWPVAPLLAAVAALLLHVRALGSSFFADDWLFLDQVRARALPAALMAPDPIGNFYRPLGRALWFWLLGRLSGESALAFHVANLALFVAGVLLVWAIARRLAGARAAALAAALFALTQAADVPVRWASGSQDLLAVTLALAGTWLLLGERRWPAALLFAAAPLAKEVAGLALLPAALLARRAGEPWRATLRRAAPPALGVAVWLACLGAYALRHPHANPVSLSATGAVAAMVNLVRTLLGVEWSTGGAPFTPPGPLALAAIACAGFAVLVAGEPREASSARAAAPPGAARERLVAAGLWALAGAAPVALVAPIWSAYFYLYALAGVALLVAFALARAPRLAAVAVVVALGWAGQRAGALPEFATAPGAFSAQSHVNDFYLGRGMSEVATWIAALRRDDPTMAPRTTVFVTGTPGFAAIQVADGPLLRGVYRDSSLRSYYMSAMTPERLRRGPVRFVLYDSEQRRVVDQTADSTVWVRMAVGEVMNGHEDAARAALAAGRQNGVVAQVGAYLEAFMEFDAGQRDAALRLLARANCRPGRDAGAALAQARAQVTAGDTLGAIRRLEAATESDALDPRPHATLADLMLELRSMRRIAPLEAYVARVLAPSDPQSWRRWGYALYWSLRFPEAGEALDRYFAMAPQAAAQDRDAQDLRVRIRRSLPGGDLQQRAIRVQHEE